MSRIAYVNGRYLPHERAQVSIEDRGFQFADGVYEVCEVRGGHLVDERRHMARLDRSLSELRIARPMSAAALSVVMHETVRRNRVRDGIVYLQITRGVARRDFPFPPEGTPRSVIVTSRSNDPAWLEQMAGEGIAVVTVPDIRWQRVDIKSVALLPNVLAKQAAVNAGVDEVIQFRDDRLTEGASCNIWVVKDGCLIAPPKDNLVLEGIRYGLLEELARDAGIPFALRPISRDEVASADELMISSATREVLPVVELDGKPVGGGKPGPVYRRLRQAYDAQIDALK